jgi:hypothetical protein
MDNKIICNQGIPAGYGYPFTNPWLTSSLTKSPDNKINDFFDDNQNTIKHEEEDILDSQMGEVVKESELRSLGAENEMRYIYLKNGIYIIRIQKSSSFVEYTFSSCLIQNYYVSSDGKKAAVKFTHLSYERTVIFDTSELSTGKVFRQLTANGYPVVFKVTGETKYCFENFISQRLLQAKRYPTITKGFNQANNKWMFCHRDNYRTISPFTYGDWDNSSLVTPSEISLQLSYNVIKNYLASLTEDVCEQSFLLFLFAYLPIFPLLKANKYELDKTIHFIDNIEVSEDIINNFLKVFNKGVQMKYHLSTTPSAFKEVLEETISDIQPFYHLSGNSEWDKYRLVNYDTLLTLNSGFSVKNNSSVPMIINMPLFQTKISKAIIIDTTNFKEVNHNYRSMIPFFNNFILKWVDFIEKNQKEILVSTVEPIDLTLDPENKQTAKCIHKVTRLLQSFLSVNLPFNNDLIWENSIAYLSKQNEYEAGYGLDSHIKGFFREFFKDESRYKAYYENASIDDCNLENQIFYSDDYIAISSDTLTLILKPLLDCNVHKKEIMDQLFMRDLLHKPKEYSYCSTAYLTDLNGQVRKKNVVQFPRKILNWLKLDLLPI